MQFHLTEFFSLGGVCISGYVATPSGKADFSRGSYQDARCPKSHVSGEIGAQKHDYQTVAGDWESKLLQWTAYHPGQLGSLVQYRNPNK